MTLKFHWLQIFVIIGCLQWLPGCAYSIHQVYIGSMDAKTKNQPAHRWVEAEKKQFVFLGFEFGSDYVNSAYKALEAKCPGRIAQVTTEHLTEFLFLSYNQRVILKGLCIAG
jgi:hypothetical protein